MSNDRIKEIYRLLEQHRQLTVEQLSEQLHVSRSTIRRDLTIMEEQHMIHRYYRGASISESQIKEKSMSVKSLYLNEEKKAIAKAAASLVKNDDVIYIDGGSTTADIIDYLGNKDVLIVTQAVNLFHRLIETNRKVWVLTGYLKGNTNMVIGTNTIEEAKRLRFDIAFIGANSIHESLGYSAADDLEASLKHVIVKASSRPYVLADSSKFNKVTYPKFADLNDCGVITDQLIDGFDYALIPEVYYYENRDFYHLKHMDHHHKS